VNGAHSLLTTLVDTGVEVCFANPGTSEMHFVAALDAVPGMRSVLTLFEGVATGAADGYARMTGTPAAVLLHLGPGLGNGLANLHNARRAHTPMVVVVGDHATYHKRYDAPLESDIDSVAGTVSGWVRRTLRPEDVASDTIAAIEAARAGAVSTLILPADVSWTGGASAERDAAVTLDAERDDGFTLETAAAALRSGEPTVLLIGGDATRGPGLAAAVRIAEATGARVLCETFPARLERGAGVPAVERLAYFAEAAAEQLAGARHLVLAGAVSPVSFFAYPGKPSDLVPEGATVHTVATHRGAATALERLADELAPGTTATTTPAQRPELPTGELTAFSAAAVIGALLPEGAVVVDESNTASVAVAAATAGAPAHDLLTLTGGAIGYGIPAAVGAALGAPGRPVVSLQADGSALYTISALWTQARENLDVTTVIFDNGAYDILRIELQRVGATSGTDAGPAARQLLDLGSPAMDFVQLAEGFGVPGRRARTAEDLAAALTDALAEPGPHLIVAAVPSLVG
jgi:acetolactate synthase I/II/III large subunit